MIKGVESTIYTIQYENSFSELRVGPCPVVQSSNPYEFDFCGNYLFLR